MALKLVSLNIERSKHLDLVLPFIEREQPDVLCLQEVMARDVEALARASAAATHHFAPTCYHPAEIELALEGDAIFCRQSATFEAPYYRGDPAKIRTMEIAGGSPTDALRDQSCPLLIARLEEGWTFATTHFTWTPNGQPNDAQRTDLGNLMALLEELNEFVLCGDFNAPRTLDGKHGEIFGRLAAEYRDNIPVEYTTSIDKDIHRAGDLQLMVDGLFSAPRYLCRDVQLVGGVSDHMAIIATVDFA